MRVAIFFFFIYNKYIEFISLQKGSVIMSSSINSSLPPPWPNQALAQSREAHSIPMKDTDLTVQRSEVVASAKQEMSGNSETSQTLVSNIRQLDISA